MSRPSKHGIREVVRVPCECGAEEIVLEVEEDEPYIDEFAYFCIWSVGLRLRYNPIRRAFHHIWKILKDGHPYQDSILLDADSCERLSEGLLNTAKVLRKNVKRQAVLDAEYARARKRKDKSTVLAPVAFDFPGGEDKWVECDDCEGHGWGQHAQDLSYEHCDECRGTGYVPKDGYDAAHQDKWEIEVIDEKAVWVIIKKKDGTVVKNRVARGSITRP